MNGYTDSGKTNPVIVRLDASASTRTLDIARKGGTSAFEERRDFPCDYLPDQDRAHVAGLVDLDPMSVMEASR